MVSRNIYLQLVFRIIFIVITVVVSTYFFFNNSCSPSIVIGVHFILLIM